MQKVKKSFSMYAAMPLLCVAALFSCSKSDDAAVLPEQKEEVPSATISPSGIARMLSRVPFDAGQVEEVWQAVNSSVGNGYDEEYPFELMLHSPGSGVGDRMISASPENLPSRSNETVYDFGNVIREYASGMLQTRSDDFISGLAESGLQIYWPYYEDWDGSSMPVITFDTGDGAATNVGYERVMQDDGTWTVREIIVSEDFAAGHPVWVVNCNDDAGFITPQMLEKLSLGKVAESNALATRSYGDFKTLVLKEFKAHRNYDGWLSGGSEFFVKCGAIESFTAKTEEEMDDYNPEVTDFMIKVRRKEVGKTHRFNSILVSEWSGQLSECAFLVVEDDGGKMTKWSAAGTVKIKSRSYGFEVDFPYHRSDDIVWRGKLSDSYFRKYNNKPARFGDVSITFEFI